MEWHEWYGPDTPPAWEDVAAFVGSDLWKEARQKIENEFQTAPRLDYSCCSLQKGWNLKYRKGGRALCTLYPMPGHFLALVVTGRREEEGMPALLPLLSQEARELYQRTPFAMGGRWLMLKVDTEDALSDLLLLTRLRAIS